MARLSVRDHDRNAAGLTWVYPVVSRRSGGVSVGINLNPNNACNWACVYCQVPDLVRGRGPDVDLDALDHELRELLGDITTGDFMERRVPEGARRLNDVAFSGNGEPTTSRGFGEAIEVAARCLADFGLADRVQLILITNGSQVQRPEVATALARLGELGGQIWFKLDSVTREGASHIAATPIDPDRQIERLRRAAALCPTWIQTCVFTEDGKEPDISECDAYVAALRALVTDDVPVRGVLLYAPVRKVEQPAGERIAAPSEKWMRRFAARIESAGLEVRISGSEET
jgi:wyosine [tRNA(Phe)-imidazoG37] synthetase (radical SAM superfamily)